MLQRILLAPREIKNSQRQTTFKTKCTINKMCEVIMDNSSSENVVSKSLDNVIGLNTREHPKLYSVGWIKKGSKTEVTKVCKVPLLRNITKMK